jgi:hypothetical protein
VTGLGPVAVRMDMPSADADSVRELLFRVPWEIEQTLLDQLWLVAVFVEQRKRLNVNEREQFTVRADRVLEALDPREIVEPSPVLT